jgi:hypothetical protein
MASVQTPKVPAQTVGAVGAVVAPTIMPEQYSPETNYNSQQYYDSSKVLKGNINNPVY